jgi:V8-like Glu-specific endopeptidase
MMETGVDKQHFWGTRERPFTVDEIVTARPILGRGLVPTELEQLASRRHLYVTTSEGADRPTPEVIEERSQDGRTVWRIAVSTEADQTIHLPGRTIVLEDAQAIHAAVNPNVDVSGYRPDWSHQLYEPRSLPSTVRPSLRRFNRREVQPLYIFGSDDRRVYKETSYPWRCAGKLYNSDGYMGSAALVGGNLIVTAGHMVPWTSFGTGSWWMKFVPDYFDGQSLWGAGIESYVSDVWGYNNGVAGYDWAIGRLYNPLGNSLGYFGFNGYSSAWDGNSWWTCIGYPVDVAGGERPSWQGGISIHDEDGDANGGEELESRTADVNHGDSGGPLFGWFNGDPRVIGVVSGEEAEYKFPFFVEDNNIFSSGSGLTNLIAWGRSNW